MDYCVTFIYRHQQLCLLDCVGRYKFDVSHNYEIPDAVRWLRLILMDTRQLTKFLEPDV